MKQDSWEYKPTHKLLIATNHMPDVAGSDFALWRRIKVVPFSQTFSSHTHQSHPTHLRSDATLATKLSACRPAILRWMVEGCVAWQQHGLKAPPGIQKATEDYRVDQDSIGRFLGECTRKAQDGIISGAELFSAYSNWCRSVGLSQLNGTAFGREMKSRLKHKKSNGIRYLGVELVPHGSGLEGAEG